MSLNEYLKKELYGGDTWLSNLSKKHHNQDDELADENVDYSADKNASISGYSDLSDIDERRRDMYEKQLEWIKKEKANASSLSANFMANLRGPQAEIARQNRILALNKAEESAMDTLNKAKTERDYIELSDQYLNEKDSLKKAQLKNLMLTRHPDMLKKQRDALEPYSAEGKLMTDAYPGDQARIASGMDEFIKNQSNLTKAQISNYDRQNVASMEDGGGGFDKKGNYITQSGIVINASEVKKDRENRTKNAVNNRNLSSISAKDFKDATSYIYSPDSWTSSISGVLSSSTHAAQAKIWENVLGVVSDLYPPGSVTEAEGKRVLATFPGFKNEKNLKSWVKGLNDRLIANSQEQDDKYGTSKWYGEKGAPAIKEIDYSKKSDKKSNSITTEINGKKVKITRE